MLTASLSVRSSLNELIQKKIVPTSNSFQAFIYTQLNAFFNNMLGVNVNSSKELYPSLLT